MKQKVSDYIANYFADNGIRTIFTVVGGGAMHMNDSFGHHDRLHCVYNHHEQASAIAAEAYFRANNEMAGLCVTSGPGAINALNGVAGAYQDSIPMIVVSGQCKTTLTTRFNKLNLRTLGNQEFDIVSALSQMTKYAEMIVDAKKIKYHLDKAFYLAKTGRPGPCWLDIPLDIQGAYVETDELVEYEADLETDLDATNCNGGALELIKNKDRESAVCDKIGVILDKLSDAKRPVIYAGNGIRISGGYETFHTMVEALQVPVVTCWDSIDLMESNHPLYCGRGGTMGDRAGNFAVQNSDLLICIGTRLNIYQVGYQLESWARESFVVDVDIDSEELRKPTIRVDMPVCYDAKEFMELMLRKYSERSIVKMNVVSIANSDSWVNSIVYQKEWVNQCNLWRQKYPVVNDAQRNQKHPVNVYAFMDRLSRTLKEGSVTVVANGSASVVGSAAYYLKKGSRFVMNCGLSSMGYDLPAAVGVAEAMRRINNVNPLVCIAGDGSIMMNLQELQTIVTNKYPVKIVIINNQGYQQIRITQTNLFNKNFVGLGPESGDLGFPEFGKVAEAFGIPYHRCDHADIMDEAIDELLSEADYGILEVFCSTNQFFEPKSATKRLEDGSLWSPPLEDLAPFLSKEELKKNMYIMTLE